MAKPKTEANPLNQSALVDHIAGGVDSMSGLPGPAAQLDGALPPVRQIESREPTTRRELLHDRRPSAEDFEVLTRDLRPKEMEHLISILSKQLGREGKTPTGRHVAKHGFMRDAREGEEKPHRVPPGAVLEDLSETEIAHLTKHKAIEPEYA